MRQDPLGRSGFTLIELIIVIVLLGVLSTVTIGILLQPFQAFQDQSRRASLVAEADLVLNRMTREIRLALPNSVRTTQANGNQYLEFIPSIGGGRYRAQLDFSDPESSEGYILDFSDLDDSFDVLGGVLGDFTVGDYLVVFNASSNLGSSANAYRGLNRTRLISGSTPEHLRFNEIRFPSASIGHNRFDIVPQSGPVTFACIGNQLRRYSDYGFQESQPTAFQSGQLMASRISDCEFSYLPGDHMRNGVVTLNLSITEGEESISLLYQVQVVNAP